MAENATYVERFRPDLWLYENLIAEIGSFVPPEEGLKVEFTRLLSHPAMILRVIPEHAFNKSARSLPEPLQPLSNVEGEQYASLLFVVNAIRNLLLYRHLCLIYLSGARPLNSDFFKL